jgi:hypothetical protein
LYALQIAKEFILRDCNVQSEGKLTKVLLYILNDNGYPNMLLEEGLAAVALCRHLLCDTAAYLRLHEGIEARGHFYLNDIKVLLGVCLRELTNIPMHEHIKLRLG